MKNKEEYWVNFEGKNTSLMRRVEDENGNIHKSSVRIPLSLGRDIFENPDNYNKEYFKNMF